ncbi:polysaccharide pyruvyl transferase family protein [Pseudoalteromonas fenneropenaei]|uniref:Polysaccharide pyruvyl transferase family protein n=1 Tax=Pseudoalteromonas fenneropenaei TaxID=1737459 RepID=A0ABV7CKI8_9GAMM
MLEAILQQLDENLPEYQITLSPGENLPYERRAKLGAWQKLSFRRGKLDLTGMFAYLPIKVRNLLKRYGIVTEADIDVILNASGFAYGDQWPINELVHTSNEVLRFQRAKKPYIFLPQALGPFRNEQSIKYAKIIIEKSPLIFAREQDSYKYCREVAETASILISPDFTALVDVNVDSKFTTPTVCLIPNNKVVSKYNGDVAHKNKYHYIDFWCFVIDAFKSRGFQVVLLNHEGEEDFELCQAIMQKSKHQIFFKNGLNAKEVKVLLGQCHAVVSSRYHGCVSALTQGVPCLATSWSHKYEKLFEEYKLQENIVNFLNPIRETESKLGSFLDTLEKQSKIALIESKRVKEENKIMWSKVFQLVNSFMVDSKKGS